MRLALSHFPGTRATGFRLGTWLTPVLVLLGAVPSVQASLLTFRFDAFNPSPASVFGRSVIDPANNQRVTTTAMDGGRFQMTLLSTDGPYHLPAGGTTLLGFCIEPRQFVTLGQTYTDTIAQLEDGTTNIGGMGEAKADLLRELFGRYLPDFNAPLTRQQAGALQVAVWEIVREDTGTLDVYNGDIYFTAGGESPAGTVALAQTYVLSLNGLGPKLNNLYALNNATAQDIVVQLNTPEPASMGLLGLALISLGAIRRKI